MMPKENVMNENQILGPNVLTAIVEGSWKAMLAIVKMKMETEYRLPTSNSRSLNMEVTEAEDMTPLSRRLRLHNKPAILQRRKSTFNRIPFSQASSMPSLSLSRTASCSSRCTSRMESSSDARLPGNFDILLGRPNEEKRGDIAIVEVGPMLRAYGSTTHQWCRSALFRKLFRPRLVRNRIGNR
jgi:hypothetical protein